MFHKGKAFLAAALAAVMLSSCGGRSDSSTQADNTQKATTTKATVTLTPQDSSSLPGSDSSEDQSGNDTCTPLMWHITNADGHEMTLMGSMHALKPEIYPLPERIMKAYENADVLAVECDITSITGNFTYELALMKEMKYPEGETVESHLSKETYDNLTGFLEANGYSMDMIKHYKPWAISSIVEEIVTNKAEIYNTYGIDNNLLQMAHEDKKEIYEVESYDFQMEMLMNFSDEVQDITLRDYSAENEEELVSQMSELYEIWKNGDIDEINHYMAEDEEQVEAELTEEEKALLDEYNAEMLYDRNKGMADAAEKLLKEHENTFFVVGLAHFIGDGGIIDLLTQRGYTIEMI